MISTKRSTQLLSLLFISSLACSPCCFAMDLVEQEKIVRYAQKSEQGWGSYFLTKALALVVGTGGFGVFIDSCNRKNKDLELLQGLTGLGMALVGLCLFMIDDFVADEQKKRIAEQRSNTSCSSDYSSEGTPNTNTRKSSGGLFDDDYPCHRNVTHTHVVHHWPKSKPSSVSTKTSTTSSSSSSSSSGGFNKGLTDFWDDPFNS